MNMFLSLLMSLILTTAVGFAIPIISLTLILGGLFLFSHVSVISGLVNHLYSQIWQFLGIFGEGSGIYGILTIACAGAIAGLLFESLNFYRYRLLINQSKQRNSHWQKAKTVEITCKS